MISRAARARRLPSCIACTRATGIVCPSSTRSGLRCCGFGICVAHGSRSPSCSSAVWMVKSAGVTASRSSQLDRERHGHAGPDARAVRGDNRRAADARRVDEHLAAAVLLHERGRRDLRIELLGAHRDRARRGGDVFDRRAGVDRDEHVHALGAARLDRALAGRRRRAPGGRGGRREPPSRSVVAVGRVEVEHEVGHAVGTVGAHQRRVVLDGALVREPQQRAPVVAQRVGHLALRRLGPDGRPCAPTPACTSGRSSA